MLRKFGFSGGENVPVEFGTVVAMYTGSSLRNLIEKIKKPLDICDHVSYITSVL